MGVEGPATRPDLEERSPSDVLEGWKAIADHLGRTERTVQRWEKSKGLPARRLKAASPDELPRVFSYRSELDAWWARQTELREEIPPEAAPGNGDAAKAQPATEAKRLSPARVRTKRWSILLLAFLLGVLAAAVWRSGYWLNFRDTISPRKDKIVLAVRPFQNLSGDPGQDYIAVGLTEEMVSRLGQLHGKSMGVIRLSPTYAAATPERLRKDINADYILEGSVRRIEDRVAITARLIQVRNQTVVWGESYDRDVMDLLRVQSEVARAIATEVLTNLPHEAAPPREVNREAYLKYLEGRYFWNKRTPEDFTKAITLFQQSIDLDPTYAPPYAGLADCYMLLGSAPYTALPPKEAFPKGEAAARKALQLDDTLAEAHVSLGYAELVYEWNFAAAQSEFERAIELRPDYATAHQFYAYYLTSMGRLDEAIAERKKAVELDPINPLLASALGEAYFQDRQFDLTVKQYARSLELDPSYAVALVNLGRAFEQKGMHQPAREAYKKVLALSPSSSAIVALLGHDYAVSGERTEAERAIAALQEMSRHSYVPSVYTALVYTGLGENDRAFEWLDKAADERCDYLVYIPTDPSADPLRRDPRFEKLLKRIGLTAAPVRIVAASN
jgi:TolB-like protein/Flp pilus assembly protein TadD